MPPKDLNRLLQDSRLWLGDPAVSRQPHGLSTGFRELDDALHLRGWPQTGSTELLCDQAGIGEIGLLLPALKQLAAQRHVAWLSPPNLPYPPALQQAGLPLQHCLLVRCRSQQEQLWAAEQLLQSGAFAAVLQWQQGKLADKDLRRLQLAARENRCWHIHMRPLAALQQASPAGLRIALQGQDDGLQLHIHKQPGGWSDQTLTLARDPALAFRQRNASQWPVHGAKQPTPRRLRLLLPSKTIHKDPPSNTLDLH